MTTATTSRIVVGVDGSQTSVAALRWAMAEAARSHQELEAVLAWSPTHELFDPALGSAAAAAEGERQGRALLEKALADAGMDPEVSIALAVRAGHPVKVLRAEASDPDTTMLVVGGRGHGHLGRLLLGSVSHSLTQHPGRPLVVVPGAERGGDRVGAAPGAGAGGVVVGVDGSPASVLALAWAVRQAAGTGAPVEAIHVWFGAGPPLFPLGPSGAERDERRDGALARLRAIVAGLEPHPGVEVSAQVAEGEPASVLLGSPAALLVVGASAGRVHDFLLGSTANACAQHSVVPVAIIPGPAGRAEAEAGPAETRR